MQKYNLNVHVFKKEINVVQNLIDDFFFLTLTVRGPFHRKDLKLKKYGIKGLIISEKTLLWWKIAQNDA